MDDFSKRIPAKNNSIADQAIPSYDLFAEKELTESVKTLTKGLQNTFLAFNLGTLIVNLLLGATLSSLWGMLNSL